jgi:ribonuclease P protein subunit RPR2
LSRRKQKNWIKKIATERMRILFNRAEIEFSLHPERSDRYVKLTRSISTKYNITLPHYWRGRFCKKCNKFLKPGANLRVRLSDDTISRTCLECGYTTRVPYTKEE